MEHPIVKVLVEVIIHQVAIIPQETGVAEAMKVILIQQGTILELLI